MVRTAGRIPELDGLRGIAISMVLAYHYFQLTWITSPGSFAAHLQAAFGLAWSGVDLFFVLSGFLIGGILLDARDSANYFQVFYTRRFFRIIPLYAAILLAFPMLLHAAEWTGHGDFDWLAAGNTLPWYSYWTFTQNLWMAGTERLGSMTFAVTWSLCIEEQFYLTLPILVRLLNTRQIMQCVRIGIYAAPLIRIALGLLRPHNWIALFALMPCRADSLLMGVLAAMLLRDAQWKKRVQGINFGILIPALFLGVVALAVWSPAVYGPITQSIGYTWLALFYASVLLYALVRPHSVLSRLLRVRWLCWLGGIAYGTYLLHEMVQGLLFGFIWSHEPFITGGYTLLTTLAALFLTLLIAHLSWQYFERPLVNSHRPAYQFTDIRNQDELLVCSSV